MKQRLADYIADFLVEHGIMHCFTVTGGGAMYLNDAFGHHNKLSCIYNHHEQASAIAAEGYCRIHGSPALVCVTTGPGGTNAITGVLGAWLDSIPMIIISGQVKFETTTRSIPNSNLRQLGDQEFDITPAISSMTKYAVMVTEPETIRYHLEKALFLAINGRPGPVWLDIPQNVQSAIIETENLNTFSATDEGYNTNTEISDDVIDTIIKKLQNAKHPILYAGNGIHLSHTEAKFRKLADKLKIPVVCGFAAHDLFHYNHPLYVGRPGAIGDRAGNLAVQNSDFLLSIGCRLNIRETGFNFESFAPVAYKVMVDIDEAELNKPTISIDLPIKADISTFIDKLLDRCDELFTDYIPWIAWCMKRKEKYPTCPPEYYAQDKVINPYCFMDTISKLLPEGQIIVATNATACICSFQALHLKYNQRIFSNSGSAPMGYGLPAAIGAAMATDNNTVICFEGDGSLQMNIQELATVVANALPIKIFVMNNGGYHSIRQTQSNFFGGALVGCDAGNDLMFPNLQYIAKAYGIPYFSTSHHDEMKSRIEDILKKDGPVICEVFLTKEQQFEPRGSSKKLDNGKMVSRPLDDMAPLLPRAEYESNLLPPLKEWIDKYMCSNTK